MLSLQFEGDVCVYLFQVNRKQEQFDRLGIKKKWELSAGWGVKAGGRCVQGHHCDVFTCSDHLGTSSGENRPRFFFFSHGGSSPRAGVLF